MRILISAYACEPGKGSEPEVGLRAVMTAAERHDVWVVTRQNNVAGLGGFLAEHPLAPRIRVVGYDLGPGHLRLKRMLGRAGTIWYYDRWQSGVASVARELDEEHDFHVVHHITLAAHWGRLGVAEVEKPLVVGPVGGAATSPLRLIPILGLGGLVGDVTRRLLRPLVARWTGARAAQRSAAAVLAQNREAMDAIGATDRTTILPNGLVGASIGELDEVTRDPGRRFVFASRLVGWKGPTLAVDALARVPDTNATLDIYGSGPLSRRLRRRAKRRGLGDRVRIHGIVPRSVVLDALRTGTALVHPAIHDDSPLIVAESLAMGTPVVCIDRAGPPVIAAYWPASMSRVVPATWPGATATALSAAMDDISGAAGEVDTTPARRFGDELLAVYERAVPDQMTS
ncbi:MAG: glycosyltransferase [Acidimicrobiia bacterium]